MKRLILIVFLIIICVVVVAPTYAYTAAENIELVKNYAISIGLGGLGAGTVGTIAYGLLAKTKNVVVAKVSEAEKQTAIVQSNADSIKSQLEISDAKNVILTDKFEIMANKFESAENRMNTLISEYQARDNKIAELLNETK